MSSLEARIERSRKLARTIQTLQSDDPVSIRASTLEAVQEAAEADLTLFYNVTEVGGHRQMCDLQVVRGWDAARVAEILYAVSEGAHSMVNIERPPDLLLEGFWGISEMFPREQFIQSALYRDCWMPLGVEDATGVFVFHGAALMGLVGAYLQGDRRFGVEMRQILAPLVPATRAAITAAHVLTRGQVSGNAAYVIARADGSIESASAQGESWRKVPGFDDALAFRVRQFDAGAEPSETAGLGHAQARIVRLETQGGTRYLVSLRPYEMLRIDADMLLTPAQARVAELAATGLTNDEIALELGRSVETVREHLDETYRRLHVSGRAELATAFRKRMNP